MKPFHEMTMEELIRDGGHPCDCGCHHGTGLRYLKIGRNATDSLPEAMRGFGLQKPFVVCDTHTKAAAWGRVENALKASGIAYTLYTLQSGHVEPDEWTVGTLCMRYDPTCDFILAVGSGVINDCCKVLAHTVGCPQMVVCTAPSMDGYASNSSSMIIGGIKVTLYNACPCAILADTDILMSAPDRMLWAGLGDMLAKYIAICEWRITHIVNNEYYCGRVADLMRHSLQKIVAEAPRLMERDPETIGTVTEGLILSGIAMSFAQVSRPASGLEHYFSHLWEMFSLERGLPTELHGIQVGVGTYICLNIFRLLKTIKPNRAVAQRHMAAFDREAWEKEIRRVFGKAARTLIDNENTIWHKNDPSAHARRLDRILNHWDEILAVMDEELPETAHVTALMRKLGMPVRPDDIGRDGQDTRDAFIASRDIRDKYLTSSLLWDLGLLETFPIDACR